MSHFNLRHRTNNQKVGEEKLKSTKRICSEVSVNSPRGIRGVSPEEETGGYGGKDLQKKEGFKPGTKDRMGDE